MKGYVCDKCGTELLYEQIHGVRLKKEVNGEFYYSAYCPTCKEYLVLKR